MHALVCNYLFCCLFFLIVPPPPSVTRTDPLFPYTTLVRSRVSASPMDSLVITDSIMATEAVRVSQTVRQITVAPLLAEAMRRISGEQSVSRDRKSTRLNSSH